MQVLRAGLALVIVSVLAVGCSGAPAGATPGPQSTPGGAATSGGGGGRPAGWDANGKAHFEISGSINKSGDLGFVPAASIFTGTTGPTSLAFTIDDTQEVLTIAITQGQIAVSYGDNEMAASGIQCTSSDLRIDATSGSGSFDCPQMAIIKSDGSTVTDVRMRGTFDARK